MRLTSHVTLTDTERAVLDRALQAEAERLGDFAATLAQNGRSHAAEAFEEAARILDRVRAAVAVGEEH